MSDKFDAYREALVMETETIWPEELGQYDLEARERVAAALHADPESAANLQYVRTHTGFRRAITVTEAGPSPSR